METTGSSFTMDDITYSPTTASIPLLSPSVMMLLCILIALLGSILAYKHPRAAQLIVIASCLLPATVSILCLTAQEHAAPPIRVQFGKISISHPTISANVRTPVTVSVQVDGAGLISNSGEILRLAPSGNLVPIAQLTETLVASVHRSGYAGPFTIKGKPGEQISLRVSIAQVGMVRRTLSPPILITVGKK